MVILFTTSPYPTSWLIRKLTGEDCSHCAILTNGRVIHSNFLGLQNQSLKDFLEHNKVIHQVAMPEQQINLLKYQDEQYDFGALFYLGLRYICPLLPKKNLWQTTGMYLCSELVTDILNQKEDSMITPYQLYLLLSRENLV